MSSKIKADSEDRLYQLKITLKWSDPPIWRRVIVRRDMTLDLMHHVIQKTMGWEGYHLHQFIAGSRHDRTYYGEHDPQFPNLGADMLNEACYTVGDLAPKARSKFYYEYDFGDGWMHDVVVEKVLPPDPTFKHPICLAGEKGCPPEDCGGVSGYYNLLEILSDPNHPQYEDMQEWMSIDWDAEKFCVEDVNKVLKRLAE